MMRFTPAVFAVENTYQIMVPVDRPSLFRVKVGDKYYYDEANGILRSLCSIHRVTVPAAELDRCGAYTVCERVLIDRKPYFPESEEETETVFRFYPLPAGRFTAFHIADAHNAITAPVKAALAKGVPDLLILNGDILNHSGDEAQFDNLYEICEQITKGERPVLFSRGNHDLRGLYAERFAEYTPQIRGNTYYSFRIGSLWGIVLDCGEDKDDVHAEYGHTVACHPFRERETEFLRSELAKKEYADPGVTHRLIVVHNPFTHRCHPPFDIEDGIYTEWADLLKGIPDLILAGHTHTLEVLLPGCEKDNRHQPCPVLIGARPEQDAFTGAWLTFSPGEITSEFVSSTGESFGAHLFAAK